MNTCLRCITDILLRRTMDEMPVRLCCGQRHWTVACPDGKVMCCLCFNRFTQDELYSDSDGVKWDVCIPCHRQEVEWASRLSLSKE